MSFGVSWQRAVALVAGWLALACSSESVELPPGELRQKAALEVAEWSRLAIAAAATSRAFHGAAYEPSLESILLFGGRDGDDSGASMDDSGLASGASWIPLSSAYARRGYVRGVVDRVRARVVTYGGLNVGLVTGVSHFAETWEFDGSESSWILRSSASLPGKRSSYGLAYDSRRRVTVLFGGFDLSWKNDVYEWNGTAWSKACATAPCSAGPRPSERALPVFVYDEARGVSLLFGGNGENGLLGDTWTWDGVRWTLLQPPVAPAPRDSSAATYDPASQRVLVFGGAFSDAREAGDFWAWNGAEWSSIAQTTTPFNRRGGALVWDAKRRRGVLLGGASDGKATDAWTFVLSGSPCQTTDECHVGTCIHGACSTPPDGNGGGGAGGDAGEIGGASGAEGNGWEGGAPGAGSSGMTSGEASGGTGGLQGSGASPATGGEEPSDGPHVGGTGVTGGRGGAGDLASGATMTTRSPAAADDVSQSKSFYACGVGNPRLGRSSLWPLFILLALVAVRRGRRRQRST